MAAKKLVSLLCCACLTASAGNIFAAAQSNRTITNDLSVTLNSITGDGKASSSLSEGLHMLNILGVNGYGTSDTGYRYNYNIGLKGTDDKRNDIKNLSLTNLNYKLSNDVNTWNIGDIFENYSQYALNSALKGVSWRHELSLEQTRSLGLLYGIAYPRWDCIYGGMETKTIQRTALGANYKHQYLPNLVVGYTGVYAKDAERVNPTDLLYNNTVFAADAQYLPIPGLTVNSDLAYSTIGGDVASDTGVAFRAEAVGVGGPSRASLEYERVSPKFNSLLGSASQDREKIKSRLRYNYSKDVSMNFGLLWYRNNLDGTKTAGFTALRPEAGVTRRNLFDRATASGDLSYKVFSQNGGGQSELDHTVNASYRDTFGVYSNDTNLGYSLYRTATDIRKNNEISFNTSFSRSVAMDRVTLRPMLSLGIWNLADELASATNRITEYSLGTAIDAPSSNIVSHLRVGQNSLTSDIVNTGSNKTFFSGDIYYRPPYDLFSSCVIYGKVNYNAYSYKVSANDFRESSVTAGMNVQF